MIIISKDIDLPLYINLNYIKTKLVLQTRFPFKDNKAHFELLCIIKNTPYIIHHYQHIEQYNFVLKTQENNNNYTSFISNYYWKDIWDRALFERNITS